MGSLDDLIRDLRNCEDKKNVVKALRKEIRKPIPAVRKAIRARALETMPTSGRLNVWVSKTRITAQIKLSGRSAGVRLKGGRNSAGGRSDMRRIDAGKVRAPSWGRRGRGAWHTQTVPEGFFTRPATAGGFDSLGQAEPGRRWREACDRAVNDALAKVRGG